MKPFKFLKPDDRRLIITSLLIYVTFVLALLEIPESRYVCYKDPVTGYDNCGYNVTAYTLGFDVLTFLKPFIVGNCQEHICGYFLVLSVVSLFTIFYYLLSCIGFTIYDKTHKKRRRKRKTRKKIAKKQKKSHKRA